MPILDTVRKSVPPGLKQLVKGLIDPRRNKLSSSISDNNKYPEFCLQASLSARRFKSFRSNRLRNYAYRQILEHLSEDQGALYVEEIRRIDPDIFNDLEAFRKNDWCGNPEVFHYPGLGAFAPTTLRYIKVFAELRALFGPLSGFSIAEIGVGYGGQCRVIHAIDSTQSYTLIDLRPVLMLAQRFLDHFVLRSAISFKTMNELSPASYDLVISNYAFSELPRDVQDEYLRKVILRSKRGYITYNQITPEHYNSYTTAELLSMVPQSELISDRPQLAPNTEILIWGQHN